MARRVLVTGATGLLGAACVAELLKTDARVLALVRDRDPSSRLIREGLLERCVEVRGDLTELPRALAEHRPTHLLHLAAQSQVPVANRSPLSTFESNVRGTWLSLEACRLAPEPLQGIVVASSDKAYGSVPTPTPETTPLQPTAPYDVSKACTDLIARSFGAHFGLPVAVTRCGNLYGPGDLNEERLIPGTCELLRAGRPPQLRSTGGMSREWLFVEDAARANLMLLDRGAEEPGSAWNVAGGETATVLEVVRRLLAAAGSSLQPEIAASDPPGEIPHQGLDASKLAALGWSAQVGLDEGLARTWAWHAG
jgi:CDP-glucose 4,6-dehydratase